VRHFPVPLRLAAVLAATLAGTGCMNVGADPADPASPGATAGVAHESPDHGGTGTLRAVPRGAEPHEEAGTSPRPVPSASAGASRPAGEDSAPSGAARPGPRPSPSAKPSRPERPTTAPRPTPTRPPSTPAAPVPSVTPEPPATGPTPPAPGGTPEQSPEGDPDEETDTSRTQQGAPQRGLREQDGDQARSLQYTPAS
jgi:hypothetical protein